MNPWMYPWWNLFRAPLSGNVEQDISPTWFSPQLEFNFAGNKKLESDVVAKVASYGTQLGVLSEAVLELAEGMPGEAIEALQALVERVDKIKQRHKETLETKAKLALDQLKKTDPEGFRRLIDDYRSI